MALITHFSLRLSVQGLASWQSSFWVWVMGRSHRGHLPPALPGPQHLSYTTIYVLLSTHFHFPLALEAERESGKDIRRVQLTPGSHFMRGLLVGVVLA